MFCIYGFLFPSIVLSTSSLLSRPSLDQALLFSIQGTFVCFFATCIFFFTFQILFMFLGVILLSLPLSFCLLFCRECHERAGWLATLFLRSRISFVCSYFSNESKSVAQFWRSKWLGGTPNNPISVFFAKTVKSHFQSLKNPPSLEFSL